MRRALSAMILALFAGVCAAAPTTRPADVTFAHDVGPIVYSHCAACHRPGEGAPFSLLSYEDVRRRARQIVDVTQRRFMPPWLPTEGDFIGDRRLSQRELELIKRWVEAGSPPGDLAQAPDPPKFTEGWQTGAPDLILESPPYTLAAGGADVFRNFVVPIELDSPRWIASIELRPENPRVTHHARLGVDSSNESVRRDAADPEPGYAGMAWGQDPDGQLVIWAPGMLATPGTPGVAWRLYPRSALVLHTHMQPSGKPEVVKFRIGIHFAKEPPQTFPVMLRVGSCDIDIAAGVKHHVVTDDYALPIDVDVQTVFPHAHSLCQSLKLIAELPDGSRRPLIGIEHFDENWHDSYRYREPMRLPRGTRLISTFTYDNTDGNIRNRSHPPRRVVYGSNVTDEMADVYLQISAVHADQRAVLMENYRRYELESQVKGYRKSLALYPENPWSQEALATCYVGLGEPAKAIDILERRLKASPEVFPTVSLGMALLATGDVTRAESTFRQAIAMDGKYPLAWFGLGRSLAAQRQFEPAEEAYRRVVALAPGLIEAHLNLADLLQRRGELDEAARVCTAAVTDSPEVAGIYLKLGETSARRHDWDESLRNFAKARQAAPYTHPPNVLLAVWCIGNGDRERGIQLLQQARTESPDHPIAPLMLGQLALAQKHLDAAREFLAAAASLPIPETWPQSHRQRFGVLLNTARFQLAQQVKDEALARDAVTQWLKFDPQNPQLRTIAAELGIGP